MNNDQYQLLVNSVCDIDAWSKSGTIPSEIRDKFQMLCSAFYWLAKEHEKSEKELKEARAQLVETEKHISALCRGTDADRDREPWYEAIARVFNVKEAQLRKLSAVLQHAKLFIEYARYELQPGELQMGDQFPRQGCADKEIKAIEEALGLSASPSPEPEPKGQRTARCWRGYHVGCEAVESCECPCHRQPASPEREPKS